MNQKAIDILSDFGGEVYENYSGRGMYGKTTTGIVYDSDKDFFKALAESISAAFEDQDATTMEYLCTALKRIQMDNMGTGIIFY